MFLNNMKKLLLLAPLSIGLIINLLLLFPLGKGIDVVDIICLCAFLILAYGFYLAIYSKYSKTGILLTVIAFIPFLIFILITLGFVLSGSDAHFLEGRR